MSAQLGGVSLGGCAGGVGFPWGVSRTCHELDAQHMTRKLITSYTGNTQKWT